LVFSFEINFKMLPSDKSSNSPTSPAGLDSDLELANSDERESCDTSSAAEEDGQTPESLDLTANPRKKLLLTPDASSLTAKNVLCVGVALLILSGGIGDFLSKGIYQLVDLKYNPTDKVSSDLTSAYVLALASFLACAVPPTLSKRERRETISRISARFIVKASAPSVLDIGVTGLKYAAVVFLPASVVAIVKNSVQVVGIALISLCRGKTITYGQMGAIFVTVVGNGVVFCSSYLASGDSEDETLGHEGALIGISMVVASGLMGAVRNVLEEVLLQDDGISEGCLLLVESWISLLCMILVGLSLGYLEILRDLDNPEYWKAYLLPWTIAFFVGFLAFSYGKDLGKLKVTKFGGAVLAKVLSLLFPFLTWAFTLAAFYISTDHSVGKGWETWSWLRLLGFVVISAGCAWYIVERRKAKASLAAETVKLRGEQIELVRCGSLGWVKSPVSGGPRSPPRTWYSGPEAPRDSRVQFITEKSPRDSRVQLISEKSPQNVV